MISIPKSAVIWKVTVSVAENAKILLNYLRNPAIDFSLLIL